MARTKTGLVNYYCYNCYMHASESNFIRFHRKNEGKRTLLKDMQYKGSLTQDLCFSFAYFAKIFIIETPVLPFAAHQGVGFHGVLDTAVLL